jgi:hypothetical protein
MHPVDPVYPHIRTAFYPHIRFVYPFRSVSASAPYPNPMKDKSTNLRRIKKICFYPSIVWVWIKFSIFIVQFNFVIIYFTPKLITISTMNLFSRSHKVLWTQAVLPVEISFDIFVIAYSDLQIRLVNSTNNKTAGRVEIYHPYFGWGTACGWLHWTDTESGVVCRQLGFTGMNATRKNAYYGEGSGPILLDNVKCTGNESYIWECSHRGWNVHLACNHSDDVGVDCYWCQACGDRYWTGNLIDLKVFMWVFYNRWPTQTVYFDKAKLL